jgi:hypothetical protein
MKGNPMQRSEFRVKGKTSMKRLELLLLLCLAAMLVIGCADPRTPLAPTSAPAYTETIVLWLEAVSAGQPLSATFQVDDVVETATLTLAGYIRADSSIDSMEAIQNIWIPATTNRITGYLVVLDGLGADTAWSHEDSLIGIPTRDSLNQAIAETTAMGDLRDSIIVAVDNRFVLSVWLDGDTVEKYPDAVFLNDTTLSGQHFYASPSDTDSTSVPGTYILTKARSFTLRMRQWNAADPANEGRSIEINWLSRLMPGEHILRARLTQPESKITGTIVLVHGE